MRKETRRRTPNDPPPQEAKRTEAFRPVIQRESDKVDLSGLEALANMDPAELARLLDAQPAQFELGDAVEGTITRIGSDAVFVDIGAKSEAILDKGEAGEPVIGGKVSAYIVASGEDGIRISRKISGRAASALLATAYESGVPVEGKVVGANKGGFDVRIGDARAFCPISHMDRARIEDPQLWIGTTTTFQVIEVGEKVVVSRRKLLAEAAESAAEGFWTSVKEGDERKGRVTSIQKFGVFVDIGGVDGLVPIRELGWGDVDPTTLAPGQALDVRIIGIDREKRKLTLSAKDPSLSPWARVGSDFVVGGTYPGTVRTVTEFGAFVEVAPGLQGLLHRTRMPSGQTVPKPGTLMEVRLDGVDTDKKRLSLAHPDVEPSQGGGASRGADEAWAGQPSGGAGVGSFGTFGDLLKKAGTSGPAQPASKVAKPSDIRATPPAKPPTTKKGSKGV